VNYPTDRARAYPALACCGRGFLVLCRSVHPTWTQRLQTSQAVWRVPLRPIGHSTTTDGACFVSRSNTAEGVPGIVLLTPTAGVLTVPIHIKIHDDGVDESQSDLFAHQKSEISEDAVSLPDSRVLLTSVGSPALVEGGA